MLFDPIESDKKQLNTTNKTAKKRKQTAKDGERQNTKTSWNDGTQRPNSPDEFFTIIVNPLACSEGMGTLLDHLWQQNVGEIFRPPRARRMSIDICTHRRMQWNPFAVITTKMSKSVNLFGVLAHCLGAVVWVTNHCFDQCRVLTTVAANLISALFLQQMAWIYFKINTICMICLLDFSLICRLCARNIKYNTRANTLVACRTHTGHDTERLAPIQSWVLWCEVLCTFQVKKERRKCRETITHSSAKLCAIAKSTIYGQCAPEPYRSCSQLRFIGTSPNARLSHSFDNDTA